MSERISIVVPNGTIEKLKLKALSNGHTQSALGRKILLDGLKVCDHLFSPAKENGEFITNGNYDGIAKGKCIKCGLMP